MDTSERLLEPMSKESKTTDHREDINLSGDVVNRKDQIINIVKSARTSQKAVQALTIDEQVNLMELLEEDCEPIEQECSVSNKEVGEQPQEKLVDKVEGLTRHTPSL